jgi:hypothetical protein
LIVSLDRSLESYRRFLAIRRLPRYSFRGEFAEVPDEYAELIGVKPPEPPKADYKPLPCLFDYQKAITRLALARRKFAVFADCGLGKSLIEFEFARHAHEATGRPSLIITPAMVVPQMQQEYQRFYGEELLRITAAQLPQWLCDPDGIVITNWDALRGVLYGDKLGCIVADESSMLKSHYGAWGQTLIGMGKGVPYKLCATGTPAPNDRIEYANHAVFLDQSRTVNEFLARYFVNKGQTSERWILKPHALKPFYRSLSHWCIFLSNPDTYGWKDNCGTLPPINVHIHDVDLTDKQQDAAQQYTGDLFVSKVGGIGGRAALARIGKSDDGGKPAFIKSLVESWPDESTIIWCRYNAEQDGIARMFPDAANIDGSTPYEKRIDLIDDFKSGRRRILISKPKILGFGLNLQVCTRQVFSTCQDSYEEFYQAVKRSNRIGSTRPLNVHLPVTELEAPMMENVLRKASRVEADTREQERLFKEVGYGV